MGVGSEEVTTLFLAGGFGFHMQVENAIDFGLLPGFRPSQVELVGNTSLAGAYLALLDSGDEDDLVTDENYEDSYPGGVEAFEEMIMQSIESFDTPER